MITLLLLTAAMIFTSPQNDGDPQLREDNVKEIVAAMTVEEKCELLTGGRAEMFKPKAYTRIKPPGAAGVVNEIPRLGVPAIVLSDGPAGVRIEKEHQVYTTAFPSAIALASSWNTELLEEVGKAGAVECKMYDFGIGLHLQ